MSPRLQHLILTPLLLSNPAIHHELTSSLPSLPGCIRAETDQWRPRNRLGINLNSLDSTRALRLDRRGLCVPPVLAVTVNATPPCRSLRRWECPARGRTRASSACVFRVSRYAACNLKALTIKNTLPSCGQAPAGCMHTCTCTQLDALCCVRPGPNSTPKPSSF